MPFPVTLDVKPSRRLRAALVMVHLAAGLALWLSAIDWLPALAGSLLLPVSLLLQWRRQLSCRLRLMGDGSLYRLAANGLETKMEVLPGVFVFRWLVVMRLRGEGREEGATALVVLADSLAPDEFRGLRIWLRWLAGFRTSGARA